MIKRGHLLVPNDAPGLERERAREQGDFNRLACHPAAAGKKRGNRRRCRHHPGRIAARGKYQRDWIRAACPLAAGYPGIGGHQIVISIKVCQLTAAAQWRHIHGDRHVIVRERCLLEPGLPIDHDVELDGAAHSRATWDREGDALRLAS